MAEGVPASPAGGAGSWGLHGGIVQWLVDNFCICEGYSVPRYLMYEIYVETCGQNAQNQVNPATFRKLVHLVFPDLGTWRLGTRGNARYHYDGIYIKKSSFFYAKYCYLLGGKSYHSGNTITFEKSTDYKSIIQQEETGENLSPIKTDPVGSPLSEFRRCPFWEQELAKKYSYKMMVILTDEYCNYCQDIIRNVRNQELEQVEVSLTSFWRSLQEDTVMLMSLPNVRQLLRCYDVQLYTGIEDALLHDFLEDVSIQYLRSVRLFSKKFKLWLLNALDGFPVVLQISKLKEVTVFVKRIRRKTYLSNMAKTMRLVLKNNRRVSTFKSDLRAIVNQGALDISKKVLESYPSHTEELESHTEMKCLSCLISLLGTSTDLSVFLNCLSSNLQAYVFQAKLISSSSEMPRVTLLLRRLLTRQLKADTSPLEEAFGALFLIFNIHIASDFNQDEPPEIANTSPGSQQSDRLILPGKLSATFPKSSPLDPQPSPDEPSRSKEEFLKLASTFQLRWNFLLTAVSKAMTLCHRESFGSWHLFHLLLLEYVIHILQSCLEDEEEEEESMGTLKDLLQDDHPLVQPVPALFHPLDSSPAQDCTSPSMELPWVTLKYIDQSHSPMGVSSMVLRILGFLVDPATGNKIIHVLLEDKATESTIKLSLPVGQEALLTLKDGQKFVIHISDIPQSSEENYFGESNANMRDNLFE